MKKIKIIQGDSFEFNIEFEISHSLIETVTFRCGALGIEKELSEVGRFYQLTLNPAETEAFSVIKTTYDITLKLVDDSVVTVMHNYPLYVSEKVKLGKADYVTRKEFDELHDAAFVTVKFENDKLTFSNLDELVVAEVIIKLNNEKLDEHIKDNVKHVSQNEKDIWNAKQSALSQGQLDDIDSIKNKVDKVTGESLISDIEKARLKDVTNQTKQSLGLDKVDNTSDINKPISTLVQAELNKKALKTDVETHTNNATIHVSALDKANWNSKQAALTAEQNANINAVPNKVDKKTGESLIADTEKARLSTVVNQTRESLNISKIDNTSDLEKPISTATKIYVDAADLELSQRISAQEGVGGALNAYNFGVPEPTQSQLTNYAISQILLITDPLDIWNRTWVTNLYDNRMWQLTNTPDTAPPIFEWASIGNAMVAQFTNDLAGTIKGKNEKGFIAAQADGTGKLAGVEDFVDKTSTNDQRFEGNIIDKTGIRVANIDEVALKTDKTNTITVNGNTQQLGTNPSFTVNVPITSDAPLDGKQYSRQNGAWAEVEIGKQFTWRGNFQLGNMYNTNDIVIGPDGNDYIAITDEIALAPPSMGWDLFAASGKVDDVKVDGVSVVQDKVANISTIAGNAPRLLLLDTNGISSGGRTLDILNPKENVKTGDVAISTDGWVHILYYSGSLYGLSWTNSTTNIRGPAGAKGDTGESGISTVCKKILVTWAPDSIGVKTSTVFEEGKYYSMWIQAQTSSATHYLVLNGIFSKASGIDVIIYSNTAFIGTSKLSYDVTNNICKIAGPTYTSVTTSNVYEVSGIKGDPGVKGEQGGFIIEEDFD